MCIYTHKSKNKIKIKKFLREACDSTELPKIRRLQRKGYCKN